MSHTLKITLAECQLTYTVNYQKRRRTVQLKVISASHLEITAPFNYPQSHIEKLLYDKTNWIIKKTSHLASIAANPINKAVAHGESILYMGQPRALALVRSNIPHTEVSVQQSLIIVRVPAKHDDTALANILHKSLKKWFIQSAAAVLTEKTAFWAQEIGTAPKNIKIKEQISRWGSCSSRGNINYNWRIVMAPPEVIDYLVVHELCHLLVPNHSPNFWRLVQQAFPEFKQCRDWLKTNGQLLHDIL